MLLIASHLASTIPFYAYIIFLARKTCGSDVLWVRSMCLAILLTSTAKLYSYKCTVHDCKYSVEFYGQQNCKDDNHTNRYVRAIALFFPPSILSLRSWIVHYFTEQCKRIFREFSGFYGTIFRFIHRVCVLLLHTCTAYRMHFYSPHRYNIITQMDFLVKFYVTFIVDFITERERRKNMPRNLMGFKIFRRFFVIRKFRIEKIVTAANLCAYTPTSYYSKLRRNRIWKYASSTKCSNDWIGMWITNFCLAKHIRIYKTRKCKSCEFHVCF